MDEARQWQTHAAQAHTQALQALGDVSGYCHVVSRLLAYALCSRGHRAEFVIGMCAEQHHAWVVVDGWLLDPTAEQVGQPHCQPRRQARDYQSRVQLRLRPSEAPGWAARELARLRTSPRVMYGSAERQARVQALLARVVEQPDVLDRWA